MARALQTMVADFTLDPNGADLRLQERADGARQRGDGEDGFGHGKGQRSRVNSQRSSAQVTVGETLLSLLIKLELISVLVDYH